jgi:hypothetical protein
LTVASGFVEMRAMRDYAIDIGAATARMREVLRTKGLLLLADNALPSVAGLIVGAPIKGSWWAHPLCHEIYAVSQELQDDPDTAMLKLVNAKTTFVHRDLWQDLYAIGAGRERWQMDGLSAAARALLAKIDERCSARADEVAGRKPLKAVRPELALLETRLLVFAGEEHTETGAHLKRYGTWANWAKSVGFKPAKGASAEAARARLDEVGAAFAKDGGAVAAFPWSKAGAKVPRVRALTARSR